jgi:hypothetical protein
MTLQAVDRSVLAFQLEAALSLVTESAGKEPLPALGAVAVPAVGAQLQPEDVIRSPRPVAAFAPGRRPLHLSLEVALPAGDQTVFPGEGELRLIVLLEEVPPGFLRRRPGAP